MIIEILLFFIAIGILSSSELGQIILGLLLYLSIVGVILYVLFWVVIIAITLIF